MGTSMAFYQVRNQGVTREKLQEIMSRHFKTTKSPEEQIFANIEAFYGKAKLDQFKATWEQHIQQLKDSSPFAFQRYEELTASEMSDMPVLGYRTDAPWLPFFDVNICEGYNASSKDTQRLSKLFGAPVLAFSIFDSDILMLSYSDAPQNINYNYAKPNCEGIEEYDTDLFQNACPTFLLELCPQLTEKKLKEIWDGEEVFADDRMKKLCEILDMNPAYEGIPDGFEAIKAN